MSEETYNILDSTVLYETVITATGEPTPINELTQLVRTTRFLKVKPETTYMSYEQHSETSYTGVQSVLVVAYYSDKDIGTFISRETNVFSFTTPQNCNYIRISTKNDNNALLNITNNNHIISEKFLPYINSRIPKINLLDNKEYFYHYCSIYGIRSIRDYIEMPYNIRDTGIINVYKHILLPVNTGDTIILEALYNNGLSAVYTFLKDAFQIITSGPTNYAQICDKYEATLVNGEYQFTKVYDNGNPVSYGRMDMKYPNIVKLIVPPECKYLYIYSREIDQSYNTVRDHLPNITYNGLKLYKDKIDEDYKTIFFDDFSNGLSKDIWSLHTAQTNIVDDTLDAYASKFISNDDNVYVDNNMLVLKCYDDKTGNNYGQYKDIDGSMKPIKYAAPYISTEKSLAVKNGRISARIKFSEENIYNLFTWAFWTFGQQDVWRGAYEIDIIECTQSILDEDKEDSFGIMHPQFSYIRHIGSHLHFLINNNNTIEEGDAQYYYFIDCNDYDDTNDSYLNAQDLTGISVLNKYKPTDWHVYTCEIIDNYIIIYIDGYELYRFDTADNNICDSDGYNVVHPSDIRFNIKRRSRIDSDDSGYMYIDWVKVEQINPTPCTNITHQDITVTVGQKVYIRPTFNEGCSNYAFEMSTEDDDIVKIQRYNNDTNYLVYNQIVGLSQGEATVTLTSANKRISSTFKVTVV